MCSARVGGGGRRREPAAGRGPKAQRSPWTEGRHKAVVLALWGRNIRRHETQSNGGSSFVSKHLTGEMAVASSTTKPLTLDKDPRLRFRAAVAKRDIVLPLLRGHSSRSRHSVLACATACRQQTQQRQRRRVSAAMSASSRRPRSQPPKDNGVAPAQGIPWILSPSSYSTTQPATRSTGRDTP